MGVCRTACGAVWVMMASIAAASGAQITGDEVVVRDGLGARADSFLTRAAEHGFSGAIVVARNGEVVLRKGYGLADRERGVPVGPETPFFIGSLAKQFTATAILRLAADGRLRLDDSLGTFFADLPDDKRGVTVRQLLTHTAGLPYLPSAGLFGAGSRDSVMREMLAEPLQFVPGDRYEYSTPGYILLAGIIERASGETYEQYLRTLFTRAGLASTGFVGERTRWSATPVRSYSDATVESSLADVPALPRFVGAGSIVSTVGDLYTWYAALRRGDVLPAAERDRLFAPQVRVRGAVAEAMTWLVITLPTGTLRQAAGDIGGFNAELRDYVDEGLVIAFASNTRVRGRGYREVMLNYVARLARGEQLALPPVVAAIPPAEADRFSGTYALANGGTVEVWSSGDSLMLGAADALGLAALAGYDTTMAERAAALDERARRFLSALDVDTLAATFMHASIPADARRAFLARMRESLGDSAALRSAVIGTVIDSPSEARTYVRVRAAAGDAEIVTLNWAGGMLVGIEPGGHAAYATRLRGDGADGLASFDLFTGRSLRVTMLGARELAIETNGRRSTAVR